MLSCPLAAIVRRWKLPAHVALLWLLLLVLGTPLWAAGPVSIDIADGPLHLSVAEFARQAGVEVDAPAELLAGKTGHAVWGALEAAEALRRLLAGTGVTFRLVGESRFVLAPGLSESTAELSTIEVKSEAERGYTARSSSAANKTDTPLLETPVTVQVVPREIIDDQQALSLRDAVRNVSGVQISAGEFYDSFILRGFDWTGGGGTGAVYRDGLQTERLTRTTDLAFVDHVEVIKGPESVLYGRIEPGGFVNFVSKRPQAQAEYSLEQQIGSWGLLRTVGDATGPLNDAGTVLYRLIAVSDRSDSWVDYDHRDNKSLAGSLTLKPTSRLVVNLEFERFDYKMTSPGEGEIPILGNRPLNLPRSFSIGDPILASDLAYSPRRSVFGFDWTYTINDSWSVTHKFHLMDINENQTIFGLQAFDGISTGQRSIWTVKDWERHMIATTLDLTGEIRTGAIEHKVILGADWYRYTDGSSLFTGYDPAVVPDLDVYHPVYGNISLASVNALGLPLPGVNQWGDVGLYAQDQLAFGEHWRLLLGGRYDEGRTAQAYGSDTLPPYAHDYAFSPRVAALYKVDDTLSYFTSFAKSFGLNNGLAADGTRLKPEIGKQYEVGAKANWFGGRLTGSAALYDLRKTNITDPDPTNPLLLIPIGETRSRGLELDVAGRVSDHINVIAAYSYDDVRLTHDTNGNQGNRRQAVPLHSGNVWAKYDSDVGASTGWEAGAGAYYRGAREGDDANAYQLPGYTRFDAMAAYRFKYGKTRVTARLNINNVFDKAYWEAPNGVPLSSGAAGAYYGPPRMYVGSLKCEF